ncbi:ABC transporter permease [Mesorhizobium sp. M0815]|uniref:ABC transporter permease n=1 Tax=Mesorhizobium sp. M0815 TaxID=2957005 RepID=UPI00333AE770
MDFDAMRDAFPKLIAAVPTTLILAAVSLCLGFALAVPLALMRVSNSRLLSGLAYAYVYVVRSTPLLVQMFLVYYGSGQFRAFFEAVGLWVLFRDAWFCAILALTLSTAAYSTEIIRGAIQAVPVGQIEAARAVGMSGVLQFRRVVFPIAMRLALPAYGNEIILMVKSTSLASTITIVEVTGVAKQIISNTFQPVEVFVIAGAIYLSINFIVSRAVTVTEIWLNPHLRTERAFRSTTAAATH